VSVSPARALVCIASLVVVAVLTLAAVLAMTAGNAAAEPRLVDRVVAIVDEEVILQSDVEREMELYRLEREYNEQPVPEDTPELRRELLDRLVESKLIIAAAKQAEMVVEEEAVEESVNNRIQELVDHLGSEEILERELRRSGMSLEDYRSRAYNQIRDEMYLRLVVGRFIRPEIEVLENEVEEYYREHMAEMPQEPDSLTLSNILIPVMPAVEVQQELRQKVAQVQEELDKGRPFAEVAQAYSEGPMAQQGGSVGRIRRGDLFDPALEQAVFTLQIGEVSEPVLSSRGVHIVMVDAVEGDSRSLRQIFFPMELSEDDVQRARQQILSARDRVEAGEPFALVAEDMSQDPTSVRSGGRLGTFALQDLSPQFQETLADVQPGQITEPVLAPAGWYLFLVNERRAGRSLDYEDVKDQIRRELETRELERKLTEYVESLRTRFFVDEKS
jgi:peptidyl-prolyl cis-trans isomerase SurA